MENTEICAYATTLPNAKTDYKAEWGANRLLLDDKMFGLLGTNKVGTRILTLKLLPEDGELLREQYEAITPGYYMNKTHWNSIDLSSDQVSDELIKKMIDTSYYLILKSLTKKRQQEIADGINRGHSS
ncbi:MmcQ/YjbR family DNA-binding protein [Pseudolactococcus plantarum]|uniref:MmcQ/YjbR family DNA-binding protein n=1 Tax=Pseudolactococcus plantarum TaxID=1365 RepID=A0A2A5S3H2_9LACT|nr:MmcQ/YjbR family DNA-binding protein [Lactococcus plantarum]PCS08025.1 hypothetical protein RU87_GL000762 [Lactococcus plantarum]HCN74520.1 MmcQ/YjbR family DNA-binding protein [Lactococcus sp.]